jgi:hypothetical protein
VKGTVRGLLIWSSRTGRMCGPMGRTCFVGLVERQVGRYSRTYSSSSEPSNQASGRRGEGDVFTLGADAVLCCACACASARPVCQEITLSPGSFVGVLGSPLLGHALGKGDRELVLPGAFALFAWFRKPSVILQVSRYGRLPIVRCVCVSVEFCGVWSMGWSMWSMCWSIGGVCEEWRNQHALVQGKKKMRRR